MDSLQVYLSPAGFALETDNTSYLIGNDDLSLLKRGYSVALRDQDKKSLGPAGVAYTRRGNVEIRIPSGDTLTLPIRLFNSDQAPIRRVILTPSSSGMVTS